MKETTTTFKDRFHNKHETVDVQYPNTRRISESSESSCPPPPPPISRGDHWKKEMILAASSSTAQPHHKDSVESKVSSSSSSMSETVPVASIPPSSRPHTKEDSSRHVQPPFIKLLSPFRISADEDSVDDGDDSGGNVNEDQDQDENIKLAAEGKIIKDEERNNFDINAAAKSLRTPDFKEDIIRNENDADHISKQVEHQRSADEGSSAPAPPPSPGQDDPGEDPLDPPNPPGQLTRFSDPVRLDCDYAASLPRLNTVANFRADM